MDVLQQCSSDRDVVIGVTDPVDGLPASDLVLEQGADSPVAPADDGGEVGEVDLACQCIARWYCR